MLRSSESTVLNHSDTLIYLTICNAIKWWQLYSHSFNNIHLSALTLYLLKSYTCSLVLRALCPDCEPRARQFTYGALYPPAYHLYGALCPPAYYLHSFNLWFIRRSYQWIDALVCKPQFIRWSPQSLTPWYLNLQSFY
jgi:hypothetical protein